MSAGVGPVRPVRGQGRAPPDDVPRRSRTSSRTSTAATTSPALEFLSPVKGPSLEQITIAVGSGLNTAEEARQALRSGRREAGEAARAAGLVDRPDAGTDEHVGGRPHGRPPSLAASGAPRRQRRRARGRCSHVADSAPIPHWFYLPAGDHLRRPLPRPDGPLVLLQPHALDAVRRPSSSASTTSPVLHGAGAHERSAQHDRLRGRDERPEGRRRAPAGDAADVAIRTRNAAPLDRLLPGPRQHGRRRHHVRGPDASVHGLINLTLEVVGIDGPAWLTDPQHRAAVGRHRRRLEGRRHRPRDLHRRDRVDPGGVLRGRPARGRRLGRSSGTSSCRSAGTRRSR